MYESVQGHPALQGEGGALVPAAGSGVLHHHCCPVTIRKPQPDRPTALRLYQPRTPQRKYVTLPAHRLPLMFPHCCRCSSAAGLHPGCYLQCPGPPAGHPAALRLSAWRQDAKEAAAQDRGNHTLTHPEVSRLSPVRLPSPFCSSSSQSFTRQCGLIGGVAAAASDPSTTTQEQGFSRVTD